MARRPTRAGAAGVLRRPWVRATLVYGVLTVAVAVSAYWGMFTTFSRWDDEGTLLVLLKAYVNGGGLYDHVLTSYGPFYFELFRPLFALTGVTTDAGRLTVVGVWTVTSLLLGLSVHRLTNRLVLGAAGMVVAFAILYLLEAEPMHPVGLALVLLAGLVLLVASWSGRRPASWGAVAGGLLAAVALTKINLGAFAIAAVALALVTTAEPLRRRAWVRWPVTAAFLAMPLVLMRASLGDEWVRSYVALVIGGSVAILVAASWLPTDREDATLTRWAIGAIAGGAALTVVTVAVAVATGSSLGATFDWVIVKAENQANLLTAPLTTPRLAPLLALAAVGAAIAAGRLRRISPTRSPWPGLVRLGAGVGIWFSAAGAVPVASVANSHIGRVVALLVAWIVVIPPEGSDEGAPRRFVRVLLPSLAVAETLQAFPVAGTQVFAAALMFVPVGALCLADGWQDLTAWTSMRPAETGRRAAVTVTVAVAFLAFYFLQDRIVSPIRTDVNEYRAGRALPFAGAQRLRLPFEQAVPMTDIVRLITQHKCTTLAGLPSLNSFHLWTSVDAPEPLPPVWMIEYGSAHQARLVQAISRSPRPCVIRNDAVVNFWMRGRSLPDRPLVRYITRSLAPVGRAGPYQLLMPR